jgi:hypothetical protein
MKTLLIMLSFLPFLLLFKNVSALSPGPMYRCCNLIEEHGSLDSVCKTNSSDKDYCDQIIQMCEGLDLSANNCTKAIKSFNRTQSVWLIMNYREEILLLIVAVLIGIYFVRRKSRHLS